MNKKYLLFDLDGTLTDPQEGITNSVAYALRQYGIIEDPKNLIRFIGPPLHVSFHDWYGFDEDKAFEAVAHYRVYFGDKGIFENAVFDGIPEMLKDLRAAGFTLVLATSKPEVFTLRILEKFDLAKYFHFVGAASLDSSRSQKADVIRHALHLCGNPSSETVVMIGDRWHDIHGARANGIQSIGVLYGYGDRPELEQAGADVIAQSVAQLQEILL